MKTFVALLVLLCCSRSGAELQGDSEGVSVNDVTQEIYYEDGESRENEVQIEKQRTEAAASTSAQQTCQPDIHTVLRELTAMVTEQRVELRNTKTELEELKRKNEAQAQAQAMELSTVGTRLTLTEDQVQALKRWNVTLVAKLQSESEDRKVAFSASLLAPAKGETGPFSTGITLVYRNIFTNIGNAYNPNTGIFTAPLRGVYLFNIFICGTNTQSNPATAALHKNGQHVVIAHGHQDSYVVNSSNGVSLLLEVGDVVYVHLWANRKIYDDTNNHSTFSGHLLFPM